MKRWLGGLLVLAVGGCSLTARDETTSRDETEELATTEHALGSRLQQEFGPSARVQRTIQDKQTVILGISTQGLLPDSDVVPAMALATYDRATQSLSVLAREEEYREARVLGQGAAILNARGELSLRQADGSRKVLAENVRGDLSPSADEKTLAMTLRGANGDNGETAVAVSDLNGELRVIADSNGVDDRPSLSPDGKTVVFVSGRTGVASLWRTTLAGGEPVQITNLGIQAGVARNGPPEGFVPPPVMGDRVQWLSNDTLRYDAGGGEYWRVNVFTGTAVQEGGSR